MSYRHYKSIRFAMKVQIMVNNISYPSDCADKYVVRMPEGMRPLIKEQAAINGRSMNAEIIFRLKQAYERIMEKH